MILTIWARLTDGQRRAAVAEHLLKMEKPPEARDSAIKHVAQELYTTRQEVARRPLERRADRLARSPSLRPEYLSPLEAGLHVRQRAPMREWFLATAGFPNLNGVIDARTVQGSCPSELLIEVVRAICRVS